MWGGGSRTGLCGDVEDDVEDVGRDFVNDSDLEEDPEEGVHAPEREVAEERHLQQVLGRLGHLPHGPTRKGEEEEKEGKKEGAARNAKLIASPLAVHSSKPITTVAIAAVSRQRTSCAKAWSE